MNMLYIITWICVLVCFILTDFLLYFPCIKGCKTIMTHKRFLVGFSPEIDRKDGANVILMVNVVFVCCLQEGSILPASCCF